MEEKLYRLWLLNTPCIPHYKKKKLYEYFGSSFHIYNATEKDFFDSQLLTEPEIRQIVTERGKEDLEKNYEAFFHSNFSYVTIEDEKYPKALKNIFDPPYGFFYTGSLLDFKKSVAIVGARRCSEYGKKMARELGQALSVQGYTVISGMARGIDSYAHEGCLEGPSPTAAVLGCGADVVYPKENHKLYERIAQSGMVLSEFPMGLNPVRMNFPQRNRIVSGLAQTVVVVEARAKSGSLITADFALEQGRDIYVVPGRIGDALSEGCNKLLTQGAGVIVSVEQFVKELAEINNDAYVEIKSSKRNSVKLSKEQLAVLSFFDSYPKSLAEIQLTCGMDYLELLTIVMTLVREGLLMESFKNHYVICA